MPDYDGAGVLEAIRRIHQTARSRDAIAVLSDFIGRYGFERIYLGQLVNPAAVPLKDILYVSDWPEELKARRQRQMAILHDPVATGALRSKRPFRWSEAYASASRAGRRVVDMAKDYGVVDGIMFPMHAIDSIPGGVSLGSSHETEISPIQLRELEIVCQAAYFHLEALHGPFPYQQVARLTARETECVQFAAAGKTSWEIAEILGVKEDTVKKTLKRAGEKLGTVNRAHLVAQAIASGQIFP